MVPVEDRSKPDKSAAIQFKYGRIEAILRHRDRDHPNAPFARWLTINRRIPPPIRRPRNVLTDPPDALTAAVESLNDVNDTHD
ncbi:hypothetical protein EVAR_98879_1 [Eumeta japonica]|uniref:Uncharacterized protein n=1 Tax=Eumeta variegata TaxID=151549 RepID=A0A4C2AGL1_EUMVA|nr:hypothetical protein EVAR_98879_1 [Eumeta japonica]